MLMNSSFDDFVLIEGIAEVLFIGYVIMLGSPAFLSSSVNASLGEVVVVVAVRGVDQTSPVMCV